EDRRRGDAYLLQGLSNLPGVTRLRPRGNQRLEFVLVALAQLGRLEPFVRRQSVADDLGESFPLVVTAHRDRDPSVVARGSEDAVRRLQEVSVALPRQLFAAHRVGHDAF